jgi:hypothetical protein
MIFKSDLVLFGSFYNSHLKGIFPFLDFPYVVNGAISMTIAITFRKAIIAGISVRLRIANVILELFEVL